MAEQLDGVSYELASKSQQDSISYSRDGASAQRVYRIAWSNREAFLESLVGSSTESGGEVNRKLGLDFGSSKFDLRCSNATAVGQGCPSLNSDGSASYDEALVTATFSPVPIDEKDNPLNEQGELFLPISTSIDFNIDLLSIPGGTFTVAGKKRNEFISVPVPRSNITVVFKNVPASKYYSTTSSTDAIEDLIVAKQGKSNTDLPDWIAGRNFVDPETLLFNGASVSGEKGVLKGSIKNRPLTVSMSFTHKPHGWNTIFIPGTGWSAVTPNIVETTTLKDLQIKYI
jgi:hypothetical protein